MEIEQEHKIKLFINSERKLPIPQGIQLRLQKSFGKTDR